MSETIDHSTLSGLVDAGLINAAHIVGQSGGWAVRVEYGKVTRPLAAQRSRQVRLFRKLETLVAYLKSLGIVRFDVDARDYQPEAVSATRSRPDRTAALKRTHEAAAYDAWFREQVQSSIDDPRPSVSDAEARAQFAARKSHLVKTAQ